jgi:hypothetical protein
MPYALRPMPTEPSPQPDIRRRMTENRYSGFKSLSSMHHALCSMLLQTRNAQPDTSYETTHSWNSETQPATSSAVSNIEYRTAACDELSRVECRRVESLCSVFFKIDRIHSFVIRHSLFDIRFFRVSFPIRLAVFFGQRRRSCETTFKKFLF